MELPSTLAKGAYPELAFVTISLGSTLASALLNPSVPVGQDVLAFALLIGLQYGVTWLSVRFASVRHLVKADPTLLCYQGQYLWPMMRKERVTEGEVLAAVRQHGVPSIAAVVAIILETDGTLTVISTPLPSGASTLTNVTGYPPSSH